VGSAGVGRFWYEKLPPPSPHLVLYAYAADSPDADLQFTNKFLFTQQNEDGFSIQKNYLF
jgi:hypothetical protein